MMRFIPLLGLLACVSGPAFPVTLKGADEIARKRTACDPVRDVQDEPDLAGPSPRDDFRERPNPRVEHGRGIEGENVPCQQEKPGVLRNPFDKKF